MKVRYFHGNPTYDTGASDVPIILLTHRVREQRMNEAIAAIEALDSIRAAVTRIRLEHLDPD
jgi:homoserine dehydrogenase